MNKNDFCCDEMNKELTKLKDKNLKDHSVIYDASWRNYTIYFNEEAEQRDRTLMTYILDCPWCGTKLPKKLADEWYDILEKDYHITDPIEIDRKRVPPEFWTDEWWKKRGL